MSITADQLVAYLQDALANRPQDVYSEEGMMWFADIAGMVSAYNIMLAVPLNALLPQLSSVPHYATSSISQTTESQQFYMAARSLLTRLRADTNAFTTAQVAQGQVHDYFEEVRQLIGAATTDILFIDPYIDAEFVTRYLPQVPAGVAVRLLTSAGRVASLAPAIALFRQQHQAAQVLLRTMSNQAIHDRHLVVDRRDVYQSGASFKDGARNAPTTINQIVDVASQIIAAHETTWSGAMVVP